MEHLYEFAVNMAGRYSKDELVKEVTDWFMYWGIFFHGYEWAAENGKIARIEELPREEKLRIWELAKKSISHNQVQMAKAIYLCEKLTNDNI